MLLVQGACCEIWAAPNSVFLPPKTQRIPGILSETQAEPGRCRDTLHHITPLFRERRCSAAPDLPSLPYLLSPAALDQSPCIDLTPSQHFPPRLSPCKTSAGSLSLGSTWRAGRGVSGLDAAPLAWLRKSLCPSLFSEAVTSIPVCVP